MYETNLGKTSMPESKSPVLLDYLNSYGFCDGY